MFRKYDNDADGWLDRADVIRMVTEMASEVAAAGVSPAAAAGVGAGGGGGEQPAGGAAAVATLTDAERDAAAEELWAALTAAEADARSRTDTGTAPPPAAAGGAGGGGAAVHHVSEDGFVVGAFKSGELVRAWVRLFRTPVGYIAEKGALGEVGAMGGWRVGEHGRYNLHRRTYRYLRAVGVEHPQGRALTGKCGR